MSHFNSISQSSHHQDFKSLQDPEESVLQHISEGKILQENQMRSILRIETTNTHSTLLKPGHLLSRSVPSEEKIIESLNQELNESGQKIVNLNNGNNNYNAKKSQFNQFIGGHPVSLNLTYMNTITSQRRDFLVCEKSDGVRYILIVMNTGECYLHGRRMNEVSEANENDDDRQYFAVNLKMPILMDAYSTAMYAYTVEKSKEPRKCIRHLFDAELIEDSYEKGEVTTKALKLLIFDTIMFNYGLIITDDYISRLLLVKDFISDYKTKKKVMKQMREIKFIDQDKSERIKFFLKDFYDVDRTDLIFDYLIPKLAHKNDGIIFTRISAPYKTGRNEDIIKWKPPHLNTIDFQLVKNSRLNQKQRYGEELRNKVFDLYVKGRDEKGENCKILFDFLFVDEVTFNKINAELKKTTENRIIAECSYDIEKDNKYLKHIYDTEEIIRKREQPNENIENILFKLGIDKTNKNNNGIQGFQERIQEYNMNGFLGMWQFSQFRLDKTSPNSYITARNVLVSIRENINKVALIEAIKGHVGERKKIFLQK